MENFFMNPDLSRPLAPPGLSGTVREAVGLFHSMDALQDAIRDLEGSAFPRHDISVLGSQTDIASKFGERVVAPEAAEDNPDMPRMPPVRSEEKTIAAGALVGGSAYVGAVAMALAVGAVSVPATIALAVIGAGGGAAVGAVLAKIMGDHFNQEIEDQIKRGGLLLWVRTPDADRELMACAILRSHGADHVHVHDIE